MLGEKSRIQNHVYGYHPNFARAMNTHKLRETEKEVGDWKECIKLIGVIIAEHMGLQIIFVFLVLFIFFKIATMNMHYFLIRRKKPITLKTKALDSTAGYMGFRGAFV